MNAADLKNYDRLLEKRGALRAELDPSGLDEGRRKRIVKISDALLAGEDAPRVYVSRNEQTLELDATVNALNRLIGRIAEAVAKGKGREPDVGQLDAAREIPGSGEALVAFIENSIALAERSDTAMAKRKDQIARQQAASDELNRLVFEGEQQGLESAQASERAHRLMKLPEEDLFAVEGQPKTLNLTGRSLGRAEIEDGELIAG